MLPKSELAHLDILGDVAEHLTSLDDAIAEHGQALLEQYDIRGFLGDVDGTVHGYADVRRFQRRSVVAVKGFDYGRLLRRRNLCEHRRGLCQVRQGRQRRHLAAENDAVHGKTNIMADLARNNVVVPSQDLHLHAASL